MLRSIPPTALWERDRAHATADVHELVHLFKGAFHHHDSRCFRGYIAYHRGLGA